MNNSYTIHRVLSDRFQDNVAATHVSLIQADFNIEFRVIAIQRATQIFFFGGNKSKKCELYTIHARNKVMGSIFYLR